MSEFPTCGLLIQFTGLIDVLQMLNDGAASFVKKRSNGFLCGPDVLVLVEHLHSFRFIFSLEDQELRSGVAYL